MHFGLNFPLSIALSAYCKISTCSIKLALSLKYFKIIIVISFIFEIFRIVLFIFHMARNSVAILLLISNFIFRRCLLINFNLDFLRSSLWARVWTIFVRVALDLKKNANSIDIGYFS